MCQESSSQNQRLRILIEQRGNPLIRSMAIAALVANLGPVLADYLRDLLQDSEPMIRSGAIRALGMMKDERGLDLICLGLLDNSPSVRLSTVIALANIGTPQAVQFWVICYTTSRSTRSALYVETALSRIRSLDGSVGFLDRSCTDRKPFPGGLCR